MTELQNKVFRFVCDRTNDMMNFEGICPTLLVAREFGMSMYKARKVLKQLEYFEYLVYDKVGGCTEDGLPWCLRGYAMGRKGLETAIYRKSLAEEERSIRELLGQ